MPSFDVCIIGSGLCGALVAEKLLKETNASILMVEEGQAYAFDGRTLLRQRYIEYSENPWPGDGRLGMSKIGLGGEALHWGANCPRFDPADFVSWPISYDDLEPYYCDAERRIGVSGHPGDPLRSEDHPMPPLPLPYGLRRVQQRLAEVGLDTESQPMARNSVSYDGRPPCVRCDTCYVCPSGAKYSPDFTIQKLVDNPAFSLVTDTQVLRLDKGNQDQIDKLVLRDLNSGGSTEVSAKHFVLAGGSRWTPALLLASDLANSSGQVGRNVVAHPRLTAQLELGEPLYPGQYAMMSLNSRRFMGNVEARQQLVFAVDLPAPEIRDQGRLLLGDDLLAGWRNQLEKGRITIQSYFEVPPAPESRIRVTQSDPLRFKFDKRWHSSLDRNRQVAEGRIRELARKLETRGARLLDVSLSNFPFHVAGGCRMGLDPRDSVCDPWGRTHDHSNLWVAGGSVARSGGCVSSSLTFAALALRAADRLADALT